MLAISDINNTFIFSGLTLLVGCFDLESGVRVTCDVGYLCANFSLPRPLCARVRPDVRECDRQTDVRQKHRLINPVKIIVKHTCASGFGSFLTFTFHRVL